MMTMKKSTVFMLCTTLFFVGTTLGFILSPIKKGIYIGNNNGNRDGGLSMKKFEDICK
jgi:hypothetical protein